jgi:hypothetical protein
MRLSSPMREEMVGLDVLFTFRDARLDGSCRRGRRGGRNGSGARRARWLGMRQKLQGYLFARPANPFPTVIGGLQGLVAAK